MSNTRSASLLDPQLLEIEQIEISSFKPTYDKNKAIADEQKKAFDDLIQKSTAEMKEWESLRQQVDSNMGVKLADDAIRIKTQFTSLQQEEFNQKIKTCVTEIERLMRKIEGFDQQNSMLKQKPAELDAKLATLQGKLGDLDIMFTPFKRSKETPQTKDGLSPAVPAKNPLEAAAPALDLSSKKSEITDLNQFCENFNEFHKETLLLIQEIEEDNEGKKDNEGKEDNADNYKRDINGLIANIKKYLTEISHPINKFTEEVTEINKQLSTQVEPQKKLSFADRILSVFKTPKANDASNIKENKESKAKEPEKEISLVINELLVAMNPFFNSELLDMQRNATSSKSDIPNKKNLTLGHLKNDLINIRRRQMFLLNNITELQKKCLSQQCALIDYFEKIIPRVEYFKTEFSNAKKISQQKLIEEKALRITNVNQTKEKLINDINGTIQEEKHEKQTEPLRTNDEEQKDQANQPASAGSREAERDSLPPSGSLSSLTSSPEEKPQEEKHTEQRKLLPINDEKQKDAAKQFVTQIQKIANQSCWKNEGLSCFPLSVFGYMSHLPKNIQEIRENRGLSLDALKKIGNNYEKRWWPNFFGTRTDMTKEWGKILTDAAGGKSIDELNTSLTQFTTNFKTRLASR